MNDTKKLTIAIPVYNVEKYLKRCIDSLINQDFEDKEILLVNDGSRDNSLSICREYENKYDYIRVIDQPNQGLAAVRNTCIKEAKGEYISFVDSDDYVLQGLYSHLMPIIDSYNIDVMCYGVLNFYEDTGGFFSISNPNAIKEKLLKFSTEQALDELLLPNNIDIITCNKIIRRSLYEGIEYPKGKYYEDMFTNYKIIAKAKSIYTTNYKYYVYCHRESSIGGMKFNNNTMDLVNAATEVYDYVKKFSDYDFKNLNVGYLTWLVVVANIMIRSDAVDYAYIKTVQFFCKKNLKNVISNGYIGYDRKIEYLLFVINFNLYKKVYKLYIEKLR